jgi:competence protein ComEC
MASVIEPGWAALARARDAAVSARSSFRRAVRAAARRDPLPSRPLVVAAAVVAAGCGLPWFVPLPCTAWWLLAVACLAAWWRFAARGSAGPAAIAVCLAMLCGAAAWAVVRGGLFPADELAWSLHEQPLPVAIEGVVVESPRLLAAPTVDPLRMPAALMEESRGPLLEPSSECVVAVRSVRADGRWRTASGRAAVIVDGEPPQLVAGSRVRIVGRGMRPSAALNPGEFDFRERSRAVRCLSIVRCHSRQCVAVLAAAHPLSPAAALDRMRSAGMAVLRSHLSPGNAPLAAALLLGGRESLPSEDSRDFLVTGTIHILSISGLHVGILALALFRLLRTVAVPRGWSLLAVAGCTGLYMLLVRAETPVVRATLLVWLSCIAAAVGRRSPAINALAAAAIVVLLCHPPELFRTGTQLSFLSTAVLIGASAALPARWPSADPLDRLIERSRPPAVRWLRRQGWRAWDVFVTGAAVWAVTAPLVAARFHVVSPVGLVLNPLVAPLVAVAMAWGFLCLASAAVSTWLAGLFGAACDATLVCIGWMVSAAAAVPGSHAWIAGPPGWWVAGWYGVGVAALVTLPRERLRRSGTWAAVAAAWVAVGVVGTAANAALFPPLPQLRAVVAAMGHGCGIVVRSPLGRCLVYDAGRLGAPGAARRGMAAVLWSEGVGRIDTLVLSHADSDHFNAVPDILERFAVGEIVVSRAFLDSPSVGVAEVLRRAERAGVPVRAVAAGGPAADSIRFDPLCRVRVLHPWDDGSSAGPPIPDNEASVVLSIESAGRRLLLTGDIEGGAVARLIATDPGRCDAIVAPHHGSRTSLPPDIATATSPDWVVVSGVGTAGWNEVRQAYERARTDGGSSTVVRTGGEGAVAVTLTADGTRVQQFKGRRWRAVAAGAAVTPGRSPAAAATLPRRAAGSSRRGTRRTRSGPPGRSRRSAGRRRAGS